MADRPSGTILALHPTGQAEQIVMPPDPELETEETVIPGEETPPEETHDGFIALDKHQKDVNVQHKRFRDEERGRVKEKERADAAEKELEELRGQNAEVVIPPVPDQYSETYQADIIARDEAITRQAEQNAADANAAAERKQKDEARLAEQNEAIEKNVATFDSNMVTHGLNPATVKAAADTVIGYGISTQFQDVLLEDKDGPLIVQYLAANPIEAEAMSRMSTLSLVNHLNSDIRAKALLLKPQTSNAPPPPDVLSGGGAPETKEAWEKGAVYE